MNTNKDQDEKLLISFADVCSLFRRHKKKILFYSFTLGTLALLFALIKPIRYQAEASFREKSIKTSNSFSSSSLLELLGSGSISSGDSEALSLFKSRKLLKDVIEKLNLQATLESQVDRDGLLGLIKSNFKIALASFLHPPLRPVLKDFCCPLKIESLHYSGEVPLFFLLNLQENGNYEVLDQLNGGQLVGWGKLGKIFQLENLSIQLASNQVDKPLISQSFYLNIDSVENTVKILNEDLNVEIAKNDKSLVKLTCKHRHRHTASQLLNTLMECYQGYLKTYHNDLALKQLDYLNLRRDHLTENLTHSMEEHANFLANDLYSAGFIETNKEMEFLARSQHEYKQKLLDKELEFKRLEQITPANLVYYERYSNDGDPIVINSALAEIRNLKQQRDALEIEMRKKSVDSGDSLRQSFEEQLNELQEIQKYLVDVKDIIQRYQQDEELNIHSKLLNDPRFLLKGWLDRLSSARQSSVEDWKKTEESFQFYLINLERLFGVHERILQERLTHQQNPSEEYQGITLEVATELYLDYSRQLIQMESTIRQNLFFIDQMTDPHFEITSLSAGLTDQVSREIIHRASELVLNLRDQNNQSMREQERIKEELNLQRMFLVLHLKQMVQLMELNKKLIDEKILALQNVSLELIHQRISLLEKNLQDYMQSRLQNIQQEKQLIKRHLESIHAEMATLPKKWVAEQLIEQEVATNHLIVEEIAKLVESKNISHNLEVIQSAPLDGAIAPVHPITPRIFLWAILGCFVGGCLGFGMVLSQAFRQGLQVSVNNLEGMGYHVTGTLISPLHLSKNKQLQNHNRETLRRLQTYFTISLSDSSSQTKSKLFLILEGQGPHYVLDLAHLLLKRGQRILTLDLNFIETQEKTPKGLLQYLQGEIAFPSIQTGEQGDYIAAGGTSPFVSEMLSSPAFHHLIEKLKPNYEWILAVSRCSPISAEAESLIPLFSQASVTLQKEKIEELGFYRRWVEQHPHYKLTFILTA